MKSASDYGNVPRDPDKRSQHRKECHKIIGEIICRGILQ